MVEQEFIDLPAPPSFDLDHYREMQLRRGTEYYEEGEEGFLTAEECRDEYFVEALVTALHIREFQETIAKTAIKTKKIEKEIAELKVELKRDESTIGVYLIESENFFGTPSAEYLREQIGRLTGIQFDSLYRPLPTQQGGLW